MARQHTNISVIKVGEDEDADDSDDGTQINLTIEGFYSTPSSSDPSAVMDDVNPDTSCNDMVVDPFSEMEPEHLARLESALQSEQAKEILGHNLEDNLSNMLGMLEGGDSNSSVHNDHSYTSPAPSPLKTPPNPSQNSEVATTSLINVLPPNSQPGLISSIIRGPRVRGRSTRGRLLTRGGHTSGSGQPKTISVIRPPVKINNDLNSNRPQIILPKITSATPASFIVAQGGRLVTQSATAPNNEITVHKKFVRIKAPGGNESAIPQITTSAPKKTAAVTIASSPAIPRKKGVNSFRGIGRPRVRAKVSQANAQAVLSTDESSPSSPSDQNPDITSSFSSPQVRSAEQPAVGTEVKQPTSSSSQVIIGDLDNPEYYKQVFGMMKKKIPTVVIKKLTPRVIPAKNGGKQPAPLKSVKLKEKPGEASAHRKSTDSPISPKDSNPAIKSPPPTAPSTSVTNTEHHEDHKKKKDKKSATHHHQSPPPVLGPELFSTPDIIRRVSVDKAPHGHPPNSQPPDASETSHFPLSQTPPTHPSLDQPSHDEQIEPQVINHDLVHDSSIDKTIEEVTKDAQEHMDIVEAIMAESAESKKDEVELSAESLLESIHAEVVKDDSTRLLAEALLLDDLTHDEALINVDPKVLRKELSDIENGVLDLEAVGEDKNEGVKLVVASVPVSTPQSGIVPVSSVVGNQAGQIETPKQPLQRKLPPIELPTTRSASKKAAAAKTVTPEVQPTTSKQPTQPKKAVQALVVSVKEKRASVEKKQTKQSAGPKAPELDIDADEEEMVSDDESWKSEDDPDRLWCICRKPHNNRFMICCDTCEDWFHGKCVGITKALGQQMEQRGIEWSCPNCKELKKAASKTPIKSPEPQVKPPTKSAHSVPPDQMIIGSLKCVECDKPARANSLYCNEVCVKKHVLNRLVMIKKETEISSSQSKVALMERKTGKVLPIEKAPSIDGLVDWLLVNQTYEIMTPSALPANVKFYKDASVTSAPKPSVTSQDTVAPTPKPPQLKQLVLTGKMSPGGLKSISLTTKGQPLKSHGIQLIQPQPLPSPQEVLKATKAAEDDLKGKSPRIIVVSKSVADSSGVPPSASTTPTGPKKELPKKREVVVTVLKKKEEPVNKKEIPNKKKEEHTPLSAKKRDEDKTAPIKKKEEALTSPSLKKKEELPATPVIKKKDPVPTTVTKKQELMSPPLKRKEEPVQKKEEHPKKREIIVVKKKEETPVVKKRDRKRKESVTEVSPVVKQDEASEKDKTEPIRSNVKRTLQELLTQRTKDDPELNKVLDEVTGLSAQIEEELFNFFKDTGAKYKSKYRSLVFNIKDPKNLTLYKKIVDKSISPFQLVRLTPDELASQELAQWRENEAKHQIEIIKKNELDLIHQAKTVVLKSRKGEEIIETKNLDANISELESALNRTADDEMDELEKTEAKIKEAELELKMLEEQLGKDQKEEKRKSEKKKDKKSSRDDRKSRGRSRSRSRKRSRSRSRSKSRDKRRSSGRSSSRRSSSRRSSSRRSSEKDARHKEKKDTEIRIEIPEEMPPSIPFLKEVPDPFPPEEPLEESRKGDSLLLIESKEEDLSDREPSSTVEIKTPPFEEPENLPLWSGVLNMSELTKLYTTAYEVSGCCEDLGVELGDPLHCVGRIVPESVWEYVSRMKKAGTKDIILIRFQSDTEEEKMNYLSIYSYLNSKNRMAVIESTSKSIKDFYVFPLASHSPVPQVLLPLDGPGFEDYRPHLLLGIIVRSRKKKPLKISDNRIGGERSYTPPLPSDGGSTPPLPNKGTYPSLTPPLPEDNGSPYSPGTDADDPYSPQDSQTEEIIVRPNIQDDLAEVNWMIQQKQKKLETITQFQKVVSDSPGPSAGSFTPPRNRETIPFFESKFPDINLPPDLPEILAHINKGSAPIGPLDIKCDPIVQAYTNSKLDYEDEDSYSPPPPQTSSKQEPNKTTLLTPIQPPNRDPRQRIDFPTPVSTLSQLSSADLIRKAAEMEQSTTTIITAPSLAAIPPPLAAIPPPPLPPPPIPADPLFIPSQPPPLPPTTTYFPYPVNPPPIPPSFVSPPQPLFSLVPPPPKFAPTKFREKSRSPPPSVIKRRNKHFKNKKKRGKWDNDRGASNVGPSQPRPPHSRPPMPGNMRQGANRTGNYRGGGNYENRGRFPQGNRGGFNRGNNGPMFRGGRNYNRSKFDSGVQSEWDEEIRNFEQQRKVREDRERRKRKGSRSPSPRRRPSYSPPRRRSRRSSLDGD